MYTITAHGGGQLVREVTFKEWISWGKGRAYPLQESTFELRERQKSVGHSFCKGFVDSLSGKGCAPGSRVSNGQYTKDQWILTEHLKEWLV